MRIGKLFTVAKREIRSSPRKDSPWIAERRERSCRVETFQRLAERRLRQGRPGSALSAYLRISEEGTEVLGLLNRASDTLLRVHPEDGLALLIHIAGIYRREGFGGKAIALYKKALRADPSSLAAHGELTSLYRQQGLDADAETLARRRSAFPTRLW